MSGAHVHMHISIYIICCDTHFHTKHGNTITYPYHSSKTVI